MYEMTSERLSQVKVNIFRDPELAKVWIAKNDPGSD